VKVIHLGYENLVPLIMLKRMDKFFKTFYNEVD